MRHQPEGAAHRTAEGAASAHRHRSKRFSIQNCDAKYAGFFNQVYGAAKRYQYYVRHESQYAYHAGALNYVRYNPNAGCGGSDVYIENKATALLYIYTPYQPNEAALKAGAGEGDACSTYGNRNFAIIYNSMFGNPRD